MTVLFLSKPGTIHELQVPIVTGQGETKGEEAKNEQQQKWHAVP